MSDSKSQAAVNRSKPAPKQSLANPKSLRGALLRFRIMAFVTGVILGIMTLAMVWVYAAGIPEGERPGWYGFGWVAHGWLYIAYVAASLDLVFRVKWHVGKALLIMIAGTVPFMSFVAERYVTRRVEPLIEDNVDLRR